MVPKRFSLQSREIWEWQERLKRNSGRRALTLLQQPRFRAGFDFMRLRADVGEIDVVLADWWQEFSTGDDNLRQDLMEQAREELARQRTKATRTTRASADRPPARAEAPSEAVAEEGAAPRKRRRRRRSGAKKAGDGAQDSQD